MSVEFDPFSEEFFNGAYDTYRRMRDEAPVYYSRKWDFWALTGEPLDALRRRYEIPPLPPDKDATLRLSRA